MATHALRNGRTKNVVLAETSRPNSEVEYFHETVFLSSAGAATPVSILPAARVQDGTSARQVYIQGFICTVGGATAWTDATAADVSLRETGTATNIPLRLAKAGLTGNASLFPNTANVTLGSQISQGVGGTVGAGLEILGTNGATTPAAFAAGSLISFTVWGVIK